MSIILQSNRYKRNIISVFSHTNRDINVTAVAGSGKTTLLLDLLKIVPSKSDSLFLAFNNSIVDELKARNTREDAQIMTIHSCGWRAILQRYGSKVRMNPNKSISKVEKVMKMLEATPKKRSFYFYAVPKILDLMRCNLYDNTRENVDKIIEHYDITLSDEEDYKVVMKCFELSLKDKSQFDFMDMIYIPVIDESIRIKKYDYVFCDESQDFSSCQQMFIKKCINRVGRLITVGDPRQAIYGFAGADANSYNSLADIHGRAIRLPLCVSYRCAKNIVKEAQHIVPSISFAPNANEGIVRDGKLEEIQKGDWIVCRNLKPLVETCLWLLKKKVKSKIRGKDIGEGILFLINKTGAKTFDKLTKRLDEEVEYLHEKLKKKGVVKISTHPKMELLMQKIEVIKFLCGEVDSVNALKDLIQNMFSDKITSVYLSTIHKAKGLENNRIFFLCPELIPSKYATQDWEVEQEMNLKYVAITRAKEELIYVAESTFKREIIGL